MKFIRLKLFKRLLGICLVIFLSLLIIPYPILSYKSKRIKGSYRILFYKVISKYAAKGAKSDLEIIKKIFAFTHENLFSIPNAKPIDTSVFNDFIRGIGWCDQQAFSLATLLAFHNIPARFLMLRDENGLSPHTIAEIYFNNAWKIVDPLTGILFYLNKENKDFHSFNSIQLKDLQNNERMKLLKKYFPTSYQEQIIWYSQMFPKKNEPTPKPGRDGSMYHFYKVYKKRWLISFVLDYYWFIFGDNFLSFVQDRYLNKRISEIKAKREFLDEEITPAFLKFYRARNYHLFQRYKKALSAYNEIINLYSKSEIMDDVLFYLGRLYLDLKMPQKALNQFEELISKYPNSGWNDSVVYYFKGKAIEELGDFEKALKAYFKAAPNLQTPALERYSNLVEKLNLD